MIRFVRTSILLLVLALISCGEEDTRNPIEVALDSPSQKIRQVIDNLEQHEVQIALSVIDASSDFPELFDYEFQVNDSVYFYPASTVKLPMAVVAMEQLFDNGIFDLDLQYTVAGDSVVTTFRSDIEAIFAVSSNKAYNNLFEWLGPDFVNYRLEELGIAPVRLAHRLSTPNANDPELKVIEFTKSGTTGFITNPSPMNPVQPLHLERISKGIGYMVNDSLVNQPMDFSYKNYYPITSMHNTMKRIVFPEYFNSEQQFRLNPELQLFLLESMQKTPREAGYLGKDFYDSYVKFFMFGDSKDPIPEDIIIHNKVGYAYGYLTDTAYIVDTTNQLAFLLTATVHVNQNGIFNDDNYEYESVGIPFLAQLGREIHKELINRK